MNPLTTAQTTALHRALESEITGEVRFAPIDRAMYATDASLYQIMPVGVVVPRTDEDVIHTVRCCREHGVSITARGGGTSQAGQAIGSGVQLDFSKYMNRIIAIDTDAKTVRVQPGIVLDELNAKLKPHGLNLPLDLSTSNRATIGGMIANNSSGTRSVVYGKTLDYVMELKVVLSDGSVVQMEPLGPQALLEKCGQQDLEGACHRVTRDLASQHAPEIDNRYPKILRRVGGYNLNEFTEPTSDRPFNLSRLLVGSEGTLGLVLEATLRLVRPPKHRVLGVVQFGGLLDALEATPTILEHQPSAVELMDRTILDATRGKSKYEPLRDFIVSDPGAILIVEFMGDAMEPLPIQLNHLEEQLHDRKLGYHFHRATQPAAQARIWNLRKAALGLSMSEIGDAKSISYVEDTAVPVDRLAEYIARFQEILASDRVPAGFYAHASVGLLHIRPVINMKTADGVSKFQRIAEKVCDLVLEFGGSLSGEHGDGLVRSPFQQKMFGPTLYEAFCEIKRTFDPNELFNPGKIVRAPPLTQNLKFGADYQTREVRTTFDFSDFGGLSRAAEQCGGVGDCRKTLTGTLCPSYMATRAENDSTRGRANALRMAISCQLGPKGFTDSSLYGVLDLCLECKACKTECPTGVDMARLKSEFLHQYHAKHGSSFRSRMLSQTARIAQWGSRLAPVSNWILQSRWMRRLNEKLIDLDHRRVPPAFSRRTFSDWWQSHRRSNQRNEATNGARVALFADTFTNYYEPQHPTAAVSIAKALGYGIIVPKPVCCGRPLISKGFLKEAAQQAAATTKILAPLADRGIPILFCEPGCLSAVRDDHPKLLRENLQEQSNRVAKASVGFEQWAETAASRWAQDSGNPSSSLFRAGPQKILLHGHCHQKALDGLAATQKLLSRIPECEVEVLGSGCCGMAGSFGYEREHYEISQAVGERILLPAVRAREASTVVVAPGFSCRHQIHHCTDATAVSPVELLASLLP